MTSSRYKVQSRHKTELTPFLEGKQKMKEFDVVACDPRFRNKETTFRSVPASRLFQDEHGQSYLYINPSYPRVEVITATLVDADKDFYYFNKYGTANE